MRRIGCWLRWWVLWAGWGSVGHAIAPGAGRVVGPAPSVAIIVTGLVAHRANRAMALCRARGVARGGTDGPVGGGAGPRRAGAALPAALRGAGGGGRARGAARRRRAGWGAAVRYS